MATEEELEGEMIDETLEEFGGTLLIHYQNP